MDLDRALEELRETRLRLVAAREEERRRLERDLHDGAQQSLVATRIKVALARSLAGAQPAELRALLEEIESDLGTAMAGIRTIVRGIAPHLLDARGLRDALQARAREAPMPVEVRCPPMRFTREVERAVYFCCAEAIQNVTKHAVADHAMVSVWSTPDQVHFEVRDDGRGFDPARRERGEGLHNIRCRVEALRGHLLVSSSGTGTTLTGSIPLVSPAAVLSRN